MSDCKPLKAGGVKVSSQTPIFGSIEDGDADEFAQCLEAGRQRALSAQARGGECVRVHQSAVRYHSR